MTRLQNLVIIALLIPAIVGAAAMLERVATGHWPTFLPLPCRLCGGRA